MDLLLRTKLKSLEVIRKPLFWTVAYAGMTEKVPQERHSRESGNPGF